MKAAMSWARVCAGIFGLLLTLAPGQVFGGSLGFVVPRALGVSSATELEGTIVCFRNDPDVESSVADYFRRNAMRLRASRLRDLEQLLRALELGVCDVLVADTDTLAAMRAAGSLPQGTVTLPEVIDMDSGGPLEASAPQTANAPQLLNYQGKLALEGRTLPTGDYTLSFSIYDKPSAPGCSSQVAVNCARRIWGPQVFDGEIRAMGHGAQVPVVKGFFNVILGPHDVEGRPIMEALSSPDRFVEVTVQDDMPILPRHQVLSVPFALRSMGEVPVGGIIMFSGKEEALPGNWRVCKGQKVEDGDSPLHGTALPDLRGRFIRGAPNSNELLGTGGRSNSGFHSHRIGLSGQTRSGRHADGYYDQVVTAVEFWGLADVKVWSSDDSVLSGKDSFHSHSVNLNGRSGQASAQENRPRFVNLHYICRIK